MKAFGMTDIGRKRKRNEDSLKIDRELELYIVADGIGGLMSGDYASRTAVLAIDDYIREKLAEADPETISDDDYLITLLRHAVNKANETLYDYSQNLPGKNRIGTTLSLAFLRNQKVYMVHVGDSRIYRLRNSLLEKLTTDHSEAQQLIDAGALSEEDAEDHPSSHALTRALGIGRAVNTDTRIEEIEPGDSFLLNTDGLFRVMTLQDIIEVLVSSALTADKVRTLIGKTLEGGAPDNVSVILLEP